MRAHEAGHRTGRLKTHWIIPDTTKMRDSQVSSSEIPGGQIWNWLLVPKGWAIRWKHTQSSLKPFVGLPLRKRRFDLQQMQTFVETLKLKMCSLQTGLRLSEGRLRVLSTCLSSEEQPSTAQVEFKSQKRSSEMKKSHRLIHNVFTSHRGRMDPCDLWKPQHCKKWFLLWQHLCIKLLHGFLGVF